MKNNLQEKHYAIYIGERLEREMNDPNDTWHHTFLMLVDETDGPDAPVHILQQLHYNDDFFMNMLPNVRIGISPSNQFKDVMAYPLVGGAGDHVLHLWNAALEYAHYIKHAKVGFSDDYKHAESAVNCRSAIVATLKSIGLDSYSQCFAQSAGLSCRQIEPMALFDHTEGETPSSETLLAKNAQMVKLLPMDWDCDERYVGPIKHPFQKMTLNS